MPEVLNPVQYESAPPRPNIMVRPTIPAVRTVVGVDIFVRWTSSMEGLVRALLGQATPELPLEMVTNRGVRVWPNGFPETLLTDHWRCRFRSEGTSSATQVVDMIARLTAAGLDVIKTETLFEFDGKPGFSLGQGQ
jgi:isocitrate dehydrogenase